MDDEFIVSFIKDNCYSLEIDGYFLVFDYYKGILNIPDDKKIIFIATSNQPHHYTSQILKVFKKEDFTYILNSDIAYNRSEKNIIYLKNQELSIASLKKLYRAKNVNFIEADKSYKIDGLEIHSLSFAKSLSLLIRIKDIDIIYIGGDIYDTKEDLDFGVFDLDLDIDLAFFPILSKDLLFRKKEVEEFLKRAKPKVFLPTGLKDREDLALELVKELGEKFKSLRYISEDKKEFYIKIDKPL
ncbi:MAG: MBL fold metallo-hydrolase [Anaerococcus sp.]|nr:MBL fold metallo-hydrolase [Anaerococcus sp.]